MERYNTFSQYLKSKYSFKINKIPIDAEFTCPNRDGRKGTGGCTYCLNKSFSPHADSKLSVRAQFDAAYNFYKSKDKSAKFILYLQAYTNTYAPVSELKQLYDEVTSFPDVIGLSIGTRPDCISNAILDLIQSYTDKVDVWLEIGSESTHNKTLQQINRCHTYEEFVDAVGRSSNRGFRLVTHTIFGFPGENHADMMESVERISNLPIDEIKIHHLYISPGTAMETEYKENKIRLFAFQEWVNLCCDIIERLRPDMVIQRLMGELSGEFVIAPLWNKSKSEVLSAIRQELKTRNSSQGSLYNPQKTL